MKPIKIENEYGETIEIQRGPIKGQIQIRHSDVDQKEFGEFVDLAATWELASMLIPGIQPHLVAVQKHGFDAILWHHGESKILSAAEVKLIRAAIKKLE
ncbi:MAG: hypothetical protein ABSA45_06325 [Verrucomicrobiota bacterium]|jgi:hypothetical protein